MASSPFNDTSDLIGDDSVSQAYYQLFMKYTRDILLVMSVDGKILDANAVAEKTYGYSMEALRHLSIHDLRDPLSLELLDPQMHRAQHSGILFETYHQRKDGSVFPVEVSSSAAYINNNRVLISIIRDITERKEMEHLLEKEQTELKAIVENSPYGVVVMDADLEHILYINKRLTEISGYTHLDLPTISTFFEVMIPDADYRQKLASNWQSNPVSINPLTVKVRCKDGAYHHFEYRSSALSDGRIITGVVDVTDRIQVQELLQISKTNLIQSEKNLRYLFENMMDGFAHHRIILDEAGNPVDYEYLEANEAFLKLIAYPGTSLVGKRVNEIFPDIRRDTINWIYLYNQVALVNNKIKLEGYSEMLGKWLKISAFSTEPGCFAITVYDITEQKAAEAARQYFNTHDALTGLFNRTYFEMVLNEKDQSLHYPLSIVVGDMNGLKLANDAFGHNFGDSLIQETANLIRQVCRLTDTICRWGGDAFSIILPSTDEAEVAKLCQRIHDLCDVKECGRLKPSIALGFCTKTKPGLAIEKVIKTAEDNMYRNKMLQSKSVRNEILYTLETTLYERTQETHDHAERMAHYCELFQQRLNLRSSEMDRLLILARLHDIGKVGIPDHILNKPGPLSPSEWETIKKHPEIGFRIAHTSLELSSIAEEILAHHERWDGKGYPRGLKGEEIPLLSQIIAIVDSYDVMTHERSYKKAMTHADAIKELLRCSGTQFNPTLVHEFINFT